MSRAVENLPPSYFLRHIEIFPQAPDFKMLIFCSSQPGYQCTLRNQELSCECIGALLRISRSIPPKHLGSWKAAGAVKNNMSELVRQGCTPPKPRLCVLSVRIDQYSWSVRAPPASDCIYDIRSE